MGLGLEQRLLGNSSGDMRGDMRGDVRGDAPSELPGDVAGEGSGESHHGHGIHLCSVALTDSRVRGHSSASWTPKAMPRASLSSVDAEPSLNAMTTVRDSACSCAV